MEIKYDVIESFYFPKTDTEKAKSYTTIRLKNDNKKGEFFSALTYCDEEDLPSSFVGCEIAEYKACIKALKYLIQKEKLKLKFFTDCYNNICSSKKANLQSYELKKFRKQIYIVKRNIKEMKEEQEKYHQAIVNKINNRKEFLKKKNLIKDKKS